MGHDPSLVLLGANRGAIMSSTKRDIMQHYNWLPTPEEFVRASTLAWLRVGYEAIRLIACAVKQNNPANVKVSERRNDNE